MFAPRGDVEAGLAGDLSERTATHKPRQRAQFAEATPLFEHAIARVLQRMRWDAELSECQLGNLLGIDRAAVVRNESGTKVPRIELCWAWALACGQTLEAFAAEVERIVSERKP